VKKEKWRNTKRESGKKRRKRRSRGRRNCVEGVEEGRT
jgi:hypothetical protein